MVHFECKDPKLNNQIKKLEQISETLKDFMPVILNAYNQEAILINKKMEQGALSQEEQQKLEDVNTLTTAGIDLYSEIQGILDNVNELSSKIDEKYPNNDIRVIYNDVQGMNEQDFDEPEL